MKSKNYTEFLKELEIMNSYIKQETVTKRLGVSPEQKDQMLKDQRLFADIMSKYDNPATKTSIIVQECADRYKEIRKGINDFRQGIKHGKKSVLIEQDYASLFIHKDKERTKHTRPDITPSLELEHIEHLNARISAHHASSHDKGNKPSLPEGVDIIEWKWVILAEKSADKISYSEHKTGKSATLKLQFSTEQTGQFCHLMASYGITSGALGASSPSLVFAIT